jgi:hypothetical protein
MVEEEVSAEMGASHIGILLWAWGSLLTFNSRQPLRADGYDPVRSHHANCQQVSTRIFAALEIRPQRVAAFAVHIQDQPTRPGHFYEGLDPGVVFYDLRASARR